MRGVYRFSALGDIAAALPVFRALKNPLILTSTIGRELVKDEFADIEVLESKSVADLLGFLWRLKRRGLREFIDLQNNDRSRFLRMFFTAYTNEGVSFNQCATRIFYDIAKKCGDIDPLDERFEPKELTYIVLNAGSSPKWLSKRLPDHKWREFSEVLLERFNLPFVMTGDRNEAEYIERLSKKIVGKVEVMAGKTSIQDLKKILTEAFLVVSTDSAPMHIAAAQKTPTIGLFGATNWIVSAPFGPWSVALWDKRRFKAPPVKNLQEIGDYYDGLRIEEGLEELERRSIL